MSEGIKKLVKVLAPMGLKMLVDTINKELQKNEIRELIKEELEKSD